ncbi:MAG TPA: cytochrome ubiquinol oxidase subunit I [Verrucomicrobiae bacterium]|nr:cytochrome ubiquinol oxidase subunit I [Verrucomicrobiae bacterium]
MSDTLFWSRLQFAFTITYHYLFPQLTMGLAWIIVYFKWKHLRTGNEKFGHAARFWARIFGINFAVGVVTGIPMEFQFGTNWADFSKFSGNIIGQTLAMEGMFAFFLESAMIGAMVWGEKRLGPRNHFLATLGVALGSWLSGYFILATNAFMQHPVGYSTAADGSLRLASFSGFLLNPWAMIEFLHNQCAALVTGSFVVSAVGALYALRRKYAEQASLFLKTGTLVGLISSLLVAFPTGDQQAKMVAKHQPVSLAAMEGRFQGGTNAELNFIGQPNVAEQRIDNRIYMPEALSFLAFGHIHANVQGLDDFPKDEWPTNIELLYYSFHVMAGLGTIFILLMLAANFQRWRGRLEKSRGLLWALMLAFPFPYIATTAGWMTAELGRQPWLIFHLLRTGQGVSDVVSGGNVLFTLIGFTGLYFVLGVLFLFMVAREIAHGPQSSSTDGNMEASHD